MTLCSNVNAKTYNVEFLANGDDISSTINSGLDKFNSGFGETGDTCEEVMGDSLVKFIKAVRYTMQGVACGIAIANGMMTFIPAITSKDQDALNKALQKFVKICIILALILLFPTLIKFLGKLCGFDLSCL